VLAVNTGRSGGVVYWRVL